MSIARKCNRCKTCFDPFEMDGEMCSFMNPTFRTSMSIAEHHHGKYLDENEGPEGIIDLCPDCAKAFRRFMSTPVRSFSEYKYETAYDKLRKKNAVENLNKFLSEKAREIAKDPLINSKSYRRPDGDTDGDTDGDNLPPIVDLDGEEYDK